MQAIQAADAAPRMSMTRLSDEQTDLITRTIAKGASRDELDLFIAQCNRTGLDPFSRQIYLIPRWDSRERREIRQVQISIDGARLTAQRSGEYAGQDGPYWCGKDGVWRDVWLSDEPPVAAKVGVRRRGFDAPLYAVALFAEYAQRTKDGALTQMWDSKSALMIAKCAEMLALRKGFPAELSGLYSSEEMPTAEPVEVVAAPVARALPPAASPAMTAAQLLDPTPTTPPAAASPAKAPPRPAEPSVERTPIDGWGLKGTAQRAVLRRIAPRGDKAVALYVEIDGQAHQWVQATASAVKGIEPGTAVTISWEWDERGLYYRATAIAPAAPATDADLGDLIYSEATR